jgi:tetratricopeptide (TPR) repeat protein
MGEHTKALSSASKAVELDISNRDAQIALAEAIFDTQGATSSIAYLSRLTEVYPRVAEYRLALGQAYARNENFSQAEVIFEQAVSLEDKPKRALIELAKVSQRQQKYEAAVTHFFKAAALDPADVEALFLVGAMYLELKKPTNAKTQFLRVLNVNKNYPRVYYYLGRAALEAGDLVEAVELAKQEAVRNPNLADSYILLAEIYDQQKQFGPCAGEYQKAVKLRPKDTDIYIKMAACHRKNNNYEAAMSIIGIAGQQESGNAEVWKELGQIYEMKGEKVRAIEAYQQYLVLAPNAADAMQIQQRVSSLSQ